MPLAADSLLDRIKLKSQLKRWRTLFILAAVFIGFLLLNKQNNPVFTQGKSFIARISINDIIFEDNERDKILTAILKNNAIKAVIVSINSPGGTVVGGETLYASLRDIAGKKPVVAVMQSVATSGGYMAALGADYIVAHRGSVTGSIGVILQTAEVTELANKLGVNLLTFKSGPLKAVPSPFEKMTPEGREAIQASVQDTYNLFVDMVAERRQLPRPTVIKLADGRIYTGGQALSHKLIDGIGGEKEALAWLQDNKKIPSTLEIQDIELVEKKGWLQEMLGSFSFLGNKFFTPRASTGLVSIWSPGN